MRTTAFLYKCFASLALLCAANTAWGQQINTRYSDRTIGTLERNKWYGMRSSLSENSKALDTFDDVNNVTENPYTGKKDMQSAHTYIDTLYVRKDDDISLILPFVAGGNNDEGDGYVNLTQISTKVYQRWYNFITGGTFDYSIGWDTDDLLTPYANCYRVRNGYVSGTGINGVSVPKMTFHYPSDSEYQNWSANGLDNGAGQNRYYVVACDVSGYTDQKGSLQDDNFVEPTLSARAIFYIIAVDDRGGDGETDMWKNGMGRLEHDAYQGGDGEGKKFLEEYNITFPCDHLGNQTDELVALSKYANAYRVDGDANDNLSVTIKSDNNMRLLSGGNRPNSVSGATNMSTSITISGYRRTISFRPQGYSARRPWTVADGSTAIIVVTKQVGRNTYNIAKFNITFRKDTRLLTQHELDRIDRHRDNSSDPDNVIDTNVDSWFQSSYQYRTPKYLRANYDLLTSRTFDYDPDVPGLFDDDIQSWYYPFPLDWGYSSYAFFDGSYAAGFDGSTNGSGNYENENYTEWGTYAITNTYWLW